jgi:uncharacterized protein (AIM24 family)/predicted negative regulator of RcsB-dependent stress response
MSAEPRETTGMGGGRLGAAGKLVAAGQFEDAERELLRVLGDTPKDLKALNLLALVRFKLGRLEDARTTYRDIVTAAPQDGSGRRNLGLVALKLGRMDEALPELEMAVRLAPSDERAWSYLGYVYAKQGQVVEAAAAFRRAKQDALAEELEHAATIRRPATPSFHFGHAASLARGSESRSGVSVLAPESRSGVLPAPSGATLAGLPVAPAAELPAVLRDAALREAALAPSSEPSSDASSDASSAAGPVALAPPLPAPVTPGAGRELADVAAAQYAEPSPVLLEAQPVPLISFVLSRLGQSPPPPEPAGPLRLVVEDEAHVRADAVLAGAGALEWHPAFRRTQGRRNKEPLGDRDGRFFTLTGKGDVWIAGAPGRWLAVSLVDDVLYVREDRVLAFDGAVSWEAGTVPGAGHMLQFRGRGTVAIEIETVPMAIKVTEDRPTLLASTRLVGWVGRLVPHGARLDGHAPFQLSCQGEGVVLLGAAQAGKRLQG